MYFTMDYESKPDGSVLVHSGATKQDDGGSWVPLVFQIGANRFRIGVAPEREEERIVVHRALFTSLDEAKYLADELARLASA
jgi:hypothetical protein